MLKGHGDDIYSYENKIVSNFSSNVYSRQDLSALQAHLCQQIDLIRSYPEPDAHSLVEILREKYAVSSESICVTNGATESIYLIAQAFQGSRTGIIIPTFSEYEDACCINNHNLSFYKRLEDIAPQLQMVWLCNPNNPDGHVYDIDYLKEIVTENQDTIFVFDQSYAHFTNKEVWNVKEAVKHRNVILLHSMTKEYAVPGLRLGYITAHPDIIKAIEKFRMPWSVNSFAIEAGKFLLKNSNSSLSINKYLLETKRLQKALFKIEGITVFPTNTHFFLCKLESRKASDLKSWLIENYGILIRDAANFRGLDESYFRIATQSPDENDVLVKAIRQWM